MSALVRQFGQPLPGDPSRRSFPTAERLARSRESLLRKLGLGYRAAYLLQLARGVVSGRLDLNALTDPARPTDEVRRDLLALPGIGPYAAATLLGLLVSLRLHRRGHRSAQRRLHCLLQRPADGAKEVSAVFEKWGRFKSLAYWFWDFAGEQQAPMEAWEARQAT